MKKLSGATLRSLLLAGVVGVVGLTALIPGRTAEAGPPIQCGPARQWICVVPGCPSCPEVLFEGTVCEKEEFEKETGRVCSPA